MGTFKFLIINQINFIFFFHPTFSLSSSIVRHFLSRNINYIHLLASIQASFLPIHQHYILPLAAVLLSDILLFVFLGRCSRLIYPLLHLPLLHLPLLFLIHLPHNNLTSNPSISFVPILHGIVDYLTYFHFISVLVLQSSPSSASFSLLCPSGAWPSTKPSRYVRSLTSLYHDSSLPLSCYYLSLDQYVRGGYIMPKNMILIHIVYLGARQIRQP